MSKKTKADSAAQAAVQAYNRKAGFQPGSKTSQSYQLAPRCYESHPALEILEDLPLVYGGSCNSPSKTDADIYVGFDFGMKSTYRQFPWKKGTEFLYKIQDMSTPTDASSFNKMIKWCAGQMKEGKVIHAGCIGGHGRTGMFLAALVFHLTERADAIKFVRKHYCKKVVETQEQVEFLVKLGMDSAKPAKDWSSTGLTSYGYKSGDYGNGSGWWDKYPDWPKDGHGAPTALEIKEGDDEITPIACRGNVWGETLDEDDQL